MYKLLFSFLFLLSLTTYSQTKEETEQWIISKLAKYAKEYDLTFKDNNGIPEGGVYQYNYKFYIEGVNIVAECKIRNIKLASLGSGGADKTENEIEKAYIPICEIIKLDIEESSSSNSGKFLRILTNPKKVEIYRNGRLYYGGKLPAYHIPYDFDEEENLIQRFNKAFVRLKTFYPKPVKNKPKEAF